MRIERVDAVAFGPFAGESLELAPGMTVVHGPNEAGKSSWHAALFAGLCGTRRGPGLRAADRAFRDRHRPWSGEGWEVGVVVALADGRRVELRHDLDGNVDATATDLATGRDISPDIISDGAPDGARFLGLSRRTLPATLAVRQGDLLLDQGDATALQEQLQRAAATAGADATAAEALDRIDAYLREHVGSERANSTRPLMAAVRAVQEAEEHLAEVRRRHATYREVVAERDRLVGVARTTATQRDALRAAVATARVTELERRLERTRSLAEELVEDAAPEALPTADETGSWGEETGETSAGGRAAWFAPAAGGAVVLIGLALLLAGLTEIGAVLIVIGAGAAGVDLVRSRASARADALRSEARRVLDEEVERRAATERTRREHRARELREQVAELETELDRARSQAQRSAAGIDVAEVRSEGDLDVRLDRAETTAREARAAADTAEGEVRQARASTPSVAAAEERLDRARDELDRIRRLREDLQRTAGFLQVARDAVHADIAPVLNETIERWLARVTAGRYQEAVVDPETLRVRVRPTGGTWRDGALLSHGTAEQVYLLLRIAMAEHLTTTEEPAPLVLDDVTTQTDAQRTCAILALLHEVSRERQVIVFTQEDAVRAWAADHLVGPADDVIDLGPIDAGS